MELNMTLRQTQSLSPQMMQTMEILQMGSQELLEYIENAAQENPVLETEPAPAPEHEGADLARKLEWLESTDVQNRYYHSGEDDGAHDPISNYGTVESEDQNLYLYLMAQLQPLKLSPEMRCATCFLVESLNGSGWLDDDLKELSRCTSMPISLLAQALEVVQSLDPAGVAGRNLAECLSLQLHRRWGDHTLAQAIVTGYLEQVGKNHYHQIACALNASDEAVREACDLIRSLNPKPGTGFSARENLTYISPDVIVVSFPDHFELLSNDYYFPRLNVSSYYNRLMKESDDREVKDYLSDKVRQAKWLVKSIEQRRGTLMHCAEQVVAIQEAFFRQEGHLVPMNLADIATTLGVHESTVSRAVKDKYLQCAAGIFPMNFFFSRGLGNAQTGASPDRAKALLRQLVEGESTKKPLSDQKLAQLMEAEGVALSRRTVAKYRDELGIPPTTGRRQ